MAKTQTRRTVSLNRSVYEAISEEAAKAGFNCAEYVTKVLREYIPSLPFTEHAVLPTKCECGVSKSKDAESCDRCHYLDSGGLGTVMPLDRVIDVLRGTDGLSLREICEELGMNTDLNNGRRQVWRWIKLLLETGRLRRYWREGSDPVESSVTIRGIVQKRFTAVACWAYALDGKTEREWRRTA